MLQTEGAATVDDRERTGVERNGKWQDQAARLQGMRGVSARLGTCADPVPQDPPHVPHEDLTEKTADRTIYSVRNIPDIRTTHLPHTQLEI